MTDFLYGFLVCEAMFVVMAVASRVRIRRATRQDRRRRNLWAVDRYMMDCDMIRWGLKP